VFLVGARFDFFHFIRSIGDVGGRRGMFYMVDCLLTHPEKGLLGYEGGLKTIVQYWRPFDHLEAFAKNQDDPHLEAWRKYWRRAGKSERTGIWHETFLVHADEYEAIYGNIPPMGLARPGRLCPLPGTLARAIAFAPPSTPESQTAAKSGRRWKSIKCFRVGPRGSNRVPLVAVRLRPAVRGIVQSPRAISH
jgi:hypothetical protein